MTGFSTTTAALISAREQGRCMACGMRAREKHHRRRRRVNHDGLAHTAANAAYLCGWGNHTGCHGRVHSGPVWGRSMGYIVLPEEDPRTVPIWHFSRGWVLLDEEGRWIPTSQP